MRFDRIQQGLSALMANLAVATLRDGPVAGLGAAIGLACVAALSLAMVTFMWQSPMLVAPIGASAVLIFAVPASPLAQPWSIIGGNTLSVLIGIFILHHVPEPVFAAGMAVGCAILVMSLMRCLHPPGGAAALLPVLGGMAAPSAHITFALMPVCANSVMLVAVGWLFHKFTCHSYPHRPVQAPKNLHHTLDAPPEIRTGFSSTDVDAALAESGEAYDIERTDLEQLLRSVERHALVRSHQDLTCANIMSRDIFTISRNKPLDAARALMLAHNIRSLPVINARNQLCGIVGLRELLSPGDKIGDVMVEPVLATGATPALQLISCLTDGKTRAVIVTGANREIAGLVTQTDLLVALSRLSGIRGG